jgi:hypothetical protein
VINGVSIPKGKETRLNLDMPKLYNTPTQLPVIVIRGRQNGPVVFISAAIHGDELNGIEIIRRVRKLKILKRLKGVLIFAPIVNVYGMVTLSRYLPDRRDLNRSFPGSLKGSLAGRLAKTFFDEIVSKCDLGIDLHTAAMHKSNLPQVRTNIENKYTFDLAKAFEAPVILHSQIRDGSLRATAQEAGVPVLLYEAGEALRFDETCIRIGVKGIINVLKQLKMLPETSKKRKVKIPVTAKLSKWIRANHGGILRTIKALGDTAKEGEVIAYIDDPFNDQSFELVSPFGGIIIGKSQIPLVQEGDAVFHIAKFGNLDMAEDKIEYFSEDAIEQSEFHELKNEEMIE